MIKFDKQTLAGISCTLPIAIYNLRVIKLYFHVCVEQMEKKYTVQYVNIECKQRY
jgi:hypothetical protein